MNNNIINLLEEIRYSYTSLQMSLFLEYFIKADNNGSKSIDKLLKGINYDLDFSNGKKYLLRKDYIEYGLETSLREKTNWGILGDMSMIHSFSYISSNFKELIDNDGKFKSYIKAIFIDKGYNFDTFDSILRLIRNISTHGSISINYTLKEKDFKDWKTYHLNKGINVLELHLNIVDKLHKLDISIDINKIEVGYNFSKIFGSYEMLMFIELCMNMIFLYEQKNNITT